jgi:hypothetical protein
MPPPDVPPLYKPSQVEEAIAHRSLKLASNARAAKEAFHEELAQQLADTQWFEADSDVVDGISDGARYAPTWSSSASTNGKGRNWLIRCRLLILSSRVAVDKYLWCPQPMAHFVRTRRDLISSLWEVIRTRFGWNSSSAARRIRCCGRRRCLSSFPTSAR